MWFGFSRLQRSVRFPIPIGREAEAIEDAVIIISGVKFDLDLALASIEFLDAGANPAKESKIRRIITGDVDRLFAERPFEIYIEPIAAVEADVEFGTYRIRAQPEGVGVGRRDVYFVGRCAGGISPMGEELLTRKFGYLQAFIPTISLNGFFGGIFGFDPDGFICRRQRGEKKEE